MYQIDGEPLSPQPDTHEWSPREPLGFDGDGAPIYAKYAGVTLKVDLLLSGQDWLRYADGQTHTLTVPARGTRDRWTQYSGVYVAAVNHGPVRRNQGLQGVEMVISGVEE